MNRSIEQPEQVFTDPSQSNLYPLCGTVLRYDEPFEPAVPLKIGKHYSDHLSNRRVRPMIHTNSLRIISLLPSATEIVAALGLTDVLVGLSHECDYPPMISC